MSNYLDESTRSVLPETNSATTTPAPQGEFECRATGEAFFKLWIVNLCLSIVTLGGYSPWATVRNKQYLFNSTSFAGGQFEYLATPMQILRGRVIAVLLFGGFIALSAVSPGAANVLFLAVVLISPLLMHLSMRFNFATMSYRHVRFQYTGTLGAAFKLFLLYPFLAAMTLFTAFPAVLKAQKEYLLNHIKWGDEKFSAELSFGLFYKAALLNVFGVGVLVAFMIGTMTNEQGFAEAGQVSLFVMLVIYAGMLTLTFLVQAVILRHVFNRIVVGDVSVTTTIAPVNFTFIALTNVLAVACSLGLAYPWAKVRMLKYKLANITTDDPTTLINTAQQQHQAGSAAAGEVADAFDVDLGLSL